MPKSLIAALSTLIGAGAMLAVTEPNVQCYEDEVIVWSAEADDHAVCIPMDDYVDIIEPTP